MSTDKGSIEKAMAEGDKEQSNEVATSLDPKSPAQKRLDEITKQLQNPSAPQIKFFKRQVKGGYDLLFEIRWKGEKFSRAIQFKSRHDLQAASALVLAIVKGLFAEEFEADAQFVENTKDEVAKLIEEVKSEQKQS